MSFELSSIAHGFLKLNLKGIILVAIHSFIWCKQNEIKHYFLSSSRAITIKLDTWKIMVEKDLLHCVRGRGPERCAFFHFLVTSLNHQLTNASNVI